VGGIDMKTNNHFPALLEAFFTDRLIAQKRVSPHTVASYRDTFRLLLKFAHNRLKKQPYCLTLDALDAPLICDFLVLTN
jgi:site-specific recombinase XerC